MLLLFDSSIFYSLIETGVMEPRYVHAFVVKLWLERRELKGFQPEWRGRIDHIQSGKRIYFRDMAEILRFVQSFMHETESTTADDQGSPTGDVS